MIILALDLGSSSTKATKTAVTVLDTQSGEIQRSLVPTTPSSLLDLVRRHGPDRAVLEQTTGAGWVVDCLRAAEVAEVQVANTRDAAWLNRTNKTDRNDADLLARLSATDQLRTVHVPTSDVRSWRALIDYRHQLVRRQTRIKNRIKAILRNQGEPTGGLWTKDGMERLRHLSKPLSECAADALWRGALATELAMLAEVKAHLVVVMHKLDSLIGISPMAKHLTELEDIGPRTAEIVAASLDDPRRFKTRKHIGSYFGIVPRVSQSGGASRHGSITKQGDGLVRAMLTQVVQSARRRKSGWVYAIFTKLLHPKEAKPHRAVQATVRRIAVILWAKCRDYRRSHPMERLLLEPTPV